MNTGCLKISIQAAGFHQRSFICVGRWFLLSVEIIDFDDRTTFYRLFCLRSLKSIKSMLFTYTDITSYFLFILF